MKGTRPRGRCKVCGKLCALNSPSGDWLGALFPRKHLRDGKLCEGIWVEITEINDDRHNAAQPQAAPKEPQ
jgi:hypothetical protein